MAIADFNKIRALQKHEILLQLITKTYHMLRKKQEHK